jgi:hypothetical protein
MDADSEEVRGVGDNARVGSTRSVAVADFSQIDRYWLEAEMPVGVSA